MAMGELSDNETCQCLPDLVVTPVVAFAICDLEQATQIPNVLSFLFLIYKVRILIIILKGCDECGLTKGVKLMNVPDPQQLHLVAAA